MRFGELHRSLPGIQDAYLTKQLRELERDGLIHREIFKQVPPKVEYSLTEIGIKMFPILKAIESWGADYRNTFNNQMVHKSK